MTQVPSCTVHNVLMREWKPGQFSCPTYLGPGLPGANSAGYCDQRVGPPKQAFGGKGGFHPRREYCIAAQNAMGCAVEAAPHLKLDEAGIKRLAKATYSWYASILDEKSPAPPAQPAPQPQQPQRQPPPQAPAPWSGQGFPGDEPGDPGPDDPRLAPF